MKKESVSLSQPEAFPRATRTQRIPRFCDFVHASPAPVTTLPPLPLRPALPCPGVTVCRSLPISQAGRIPLLCALLMPLVNIRLSPPMEESSCSTTCTLGHQQSCLACSKVVGRFSGDGRTDAPSPPFLPSALGALSRAHCRPLSSCCCSCLGQPSWAIITYHLHCCSRTSVHLSSSAQLCAA